MGSRALCTRFVCALDGVCFFTCSEVLLKYLIVFAQGLWQGHTILFSFHSGWFNYHVEYNTQAIKISEIIQKTGLPPPLPTEVAEIRIEDFPNVVATLAKHYVASYLSITADNHTGTGWTIGIVGTYQFYSNWKGTHNSLAYPPAPMSWIYPYILQRSRVSSTNSRSLRIQHRHRSMMVHEPGFTVCKLRRVLISPICIFLR